MIFAETDFTPETRVLPVSVTTLTLQILGLDHLAAGLVLKLVVLAQELETETTREHSTSKVPNSTVTLYTLRVSEDATTRVRLEAFLPVTNPGLAKVTNGSDHLQSSCKVAWMFDDTISSLHHALLLAALGTHGQSLQMSTEVTESSVLLMSLTPVTLHDGVTRFHHN